MSTPQGDPLKKVSPGDPLVIQAETFNSFIDAARLVRSNRERSGGGPIQSESRFWAKITDVDDGNAEDQRPPQFKVRQLHACENAADGGSDADEWEKYKFFPAMTNWLTSKDDEELPAFPHPFLFDILTCPKDDGDFDYSDEEYAGRCPLSCFYRSGQVVEVVVANGSLVVVTIPPMYL